MSDLVASRARFIARHPEQREQVRGRVWGVTSVAGPGPVLVLLPGTLGRGDVFWRVMSRLEGRARMLTVSYPATHDLDQWAGDLRVILRRYDVSGAHILGSSLGGYLAQYLAGQTPDLCASLIAANTLNSAAMVAQHPTYAGDLEHRPMAQIRGGFRAALTGWADAHPEQADLVALLLAECDGRIPARNMRARLLAMKHAPDLPAITLPSARVAVIEAEDDPLIPAPMRAAVRDSLRPAVTYRFRDGGHFPYVARPDDYAAALEDWLDLRAANAPAPWGTGAERVL